MKRKSPAKSGILIDVARVVSVGRNREGGAVLRFRDTKGRLVLPREVRAPSCGETHAVCFDSAGYLT